MTPEDMTQVGEYKMIGVGECRREVFNLHIQAFNRDTWYITSAMRSIDAAGGVWVARRLIDGEWTDLDREGGDRKRAAMRLRKMREVSADWSADELRQLIAEKDAK